ncbi:MAG TPA: NADH-quinone oxidoreductase subunit I [Candidatus Omnitrophota bacterium]|nr:NADH-quinone oxidoreductase subunit I [Candidatus Omnitrophota bacterium]
MFGWGVLKGMLVTLWNFLLTYLWPKKGIFTVQYPEKKLPLAQRYRNFPFLVYDGTPHMIRCVACKICESECPPKCIYIIPEKDAEGRVQKKPAVFDIDYAICMNCGLCEEVCPFDSIFMDHEYEISKYNRAEDLMVRKEALLKPWEYFAKIRPHDFERIEAKRAAKSAKAKPVAPAEKPSQKPDAGPTSPQQGSVPKNG